MQSTKMMSLQRQEQILLCVKKFDYVTRKQLQKILDLKSDRNSRRVMQDMEPYLNHFFTYQKIYYLNREGRERIGATKIRSKIACVDHYLMRTDLYIHLEQPDGWRNEVRIIYTYDKSNPKSQKITAVVDALYQQDGRYTIVEVDNEQKMKNNRSKVDKYRRLIDKNVFGHMPPRIIWVTKTLYRKEELMSLCEGLDVTVYLWSDIS